MATSAPKAPPNKEIFRQLSGPYGDPDQLALSVAQGQSPVGYDIVLVSYDASYAGGALHNYVAAELGQEGVNGRILFEGKGHRAIVTQPTLSSEKEMVLLGQIVSISEKSGENGVALDENLRAFFEDLISMQADIADAIGRQPNSLWIPILGTGAAALSPIASGNIIASALFDVLVPKRPEELRNIMIAPPENTDDATRNAIIDAMRGWKVSAAAENRDVPSDEETPADPVVASEMPDQFHADTAVEDEKGDDLGRALIATNIAENIRKVWPNHIKLKRPFAVHLSGRWGSGKSSILNFLKARLVADTSFWNESPGTTMRTAPKGWIVVDYNAWRMQDAGPPWWSLRNAVTEAVYTEMGGRGYWYRLRDWAWRKAKVVSPYAAALWLVVALLGLYFLAGNSSAALDAPPDRSLADRLWGDGSALGFLLSGAAALGGLTKLWTSLQGFSKTSTETANAIRELDTDPYADVKERFSTMIRAHVNRPVAVFIDDLDRCDANFVVELLQSLQTAFSETPVLYVVAADRDWLVSSYAQVYKGFDAEMSAPGQPLGYLFVKKIFQLSVSVPDLAQTDSEQLTNALLGRTKGEVTDAEVEQVTEDFKEEIKAAKGDITKLQEIGARGKDSVAAKQVAEALVAEVVDAPAQTQIKHALIEKVHLFDGNPRFIKRLINAITFRQSYILMAGEQIPFYVTARWSILSLRFPYTAEFLALNTMKVYPHERAPADEDGNSPDDQYFHDPAIDDILNDPDMTPEMIAKVSAFG